MEQSKAASLVEAVFNTLIGFLLTFIAWPLAAWLFSQPYTLASHAGIVGFFTIISVARQYVIRRWFNARLKSAASRITGKVAGHG